MEVEKKDNNKQNSLSLDYYVPDKLLDLFRNTKFGKAVVIAIIAHIVFIFVFSISYLLDLAFPERVKERQAKIEAASAISTNEGASSTITQNTNTTMAITNAEASGSTTPKSKKDALLEQHKDKEVVKEITQKADQKEIPKQPDLLSIFDEEKK